MLTGFYGHPNSAKRGETWHLLRALNPTQNVPWLCVGDFNEIININENFGAAFRPYRQIRDFRIALEHCELNDLGFERDLFT